MAAISTSDLYLAYLAYFGRPPDATGFAFFSDKTEAQVVAAFSASAESQALLASLGDLPAQINAIYRNLFNRDAEFGGPTSASYWVQEVSLGHVTLAQAAMTIAHSALGSDAATVTAKVNAEIAFVHALDTAAEVTGYTGTEAAADARAFLATVDATHIPTATQVDAAVLLATTPYVAPVPTLHVVSNLSSVNEGSTVLFTVATTNVVAGTAYSYSITGVEAADVEGGNLAGTVVIDSEGKAVVAVTLKADALTEGNQTLRFAVDGDAATVTVVDSSTTPPPPVPTLAVTANAGSANEGSTVAFTIATTNVAPGTSYDYTITGVNAADVVSGTLTGTVVINSAGQAVVNVALKADALTEGTETLTFHVNDKSVDVTVVDSSLTPPTPVPTLAVTANAASANEGSTVAFTIATANVAPGTSYDYSITGVNAADVVSGTLTGTVVINSAGQAVVNVALKADALTEGTETLTFHVNDKHVDVTVVDSSTTPPPPPAPTLSVSSNVTSVNEGNTVLFTVATTNVAPGTSYAYAISGIEAADVVGGHLTGTVVIDSEGKAVVQVTLVADALTEGNQTMTFTANDKHVDVTVVDSSTTPPPPPAAVVEVSSNVSTVDEGNTVLFTVATANVAPGTSYVYSISGIEAADVVGGHLTGTVVIGNDGKASVQVTLVADALTEGLQTMTFTANGEHVDVTVVDSSTTPAFVLTVNQDNLTGDFGVNTFLANEHTLNTGDKLDGGAGSDLLSVSVGSGGAHFSAPTLSNIETVQVNAPNVSGVHIEMDLSNANGVTTLKSFQVTDHENGSSGPAPAGDFVAFWDIQSVNGTDISMVDTNVDHEFSYDKVNAYEAATSQVPDTVKLRLQEVNDAAVTFSNDRPFESGKSNVDIIQLSSVSRSGNSSHSGSTNDNSLSGLYVGDNFFTLTIDGGLATDIDANLEIVHTLDRNVGEIDASALVANLTLTADTTHNTRGLGLFVYDGAQGNDTFTLTRGGNSTIDLNDGNDSLVVHGDGNMTISGGEGNDTVTVTATDAGLPDGRHNIDLGNGADVLTITGNVDTYGDAIVGNGATTIDAGSGNDAVTIAGNGAYIIDLGADNDTLTKTGTGNNTVHAGEGVDVLEINAGSGNTSNYVYLEGGNDKLTITGNGNQFITGDAGNDTVDVTSNGNHTISGGDDADRITITGNGNQSITGGQGADSITINGFGVHNVDLGTEDDYLLINGPRVQDGNIDNTQSEAMTTIVGGAGNDTVDVRADHWLKADLGTGNDLLILRAIDLTTDDQIKGNTGVDTLRLTNESLDEVVVAQSETDSTTSIEVFDLRQANITLELTADTFDSTDLDANGMHMVTVNTQNATHTDLPAHLVSLGLAQNMTVEAFTALAINPLVTEIPHSHIPNGTAAADAKIDRESLVSYLLTHGVKGVDFTDTTSDGDSHLFLSGNPISIPTELPSGTTAAFNTNDTVFFQMEPNGYQAVDITAVPLSLASGRAFTLLGGNIQDIVIADDDSINGRSTLQFDGPASSNQSVFDTLRVINGANVTAADLRNVSGLEVIELQSTSQQAARWDIELNATVINQTTGSATLIINATDEVPAGSSLYITRDRSVFGGLNNDVQIIRNANINVYIDGHLVTADEFGVTDFNDASTYSITVIDQFNFTTSTDNLVGTNGDDTFVARSIDQLQAADIVNGKGGTDTVELAFAVANSNNALSDQLNDAGLNFIERLVFNTGNPVSFTTINHGNAGWADGLVTIETGSASDTLRSIELTGKFFDLKEGNDFISFQGAGALSETIDGGLGSDTVVGGTEADTFTLGDVESVSGGDGGDTFTFALSLGGNHGNITVDGGSGADTLNLDSDGTDGVATVSTVETINGGAGVDQITATNVGGSLSISGNAGNDKITATNANSIFVDGGNDNDTISATVAASITVNGGSGDDSIVADNVGGVITVDGGTGVDTITVGTNSPLDAAVQGGAQGDVITVHAQHSAFVVGDTGLTLVESAIDGADNINVTVSDVGGLALVLGQGGSDTINVHAFNAEVAGGTGNDNLTLTFNGVGWVLGGDGNDTITLSEDTVGGGDAVAYVVGNDGNDSITIGNTLYASVSGGQGNDTINLGFDTLGGNDFNDVAFGNVAYNAAQQLTTNTQGVDRVTGFQFEGSGLVGDPAPAVQDAFNFTEFLGNTIANNNVHVVAGTWTRGSTQDASLSAGNSVVVLSAPAGSNYDLNANDFSVNQPNTIQLNDNARAVVVVGQDQTGSGSGISEFDIYFVEDINTGLGQTWAVNKVADVQAATRVGVEAVSDNLFDGFTFTYTGGNNTITDFAGSQTIIGNGGNDTINLSYGGNDTIVIDSSQVTFNGQSGFDNDPLVTISGFATSGIDMDHLDLAAYGTQITGFQSINAGSNTTFAPAANSVVEILISGGQTVNLGGVTADGTEGGSWTTASGIESLILSSIASVGTAGNLEFTVITYSNGSSTADAAVYQVRIDTFDGTGFVDNTNDIAVEQVAFLVGVGANTLDPANFV
jgi:Ca2+-binding RTX toxin-like protein